jgi:hypothetical protein
MGRGTQRRHKVRRLGFQVCRCNTEQAHQSSVLCDVQKLSAHGGGSDHAERHLYQKSKKSMGSHHSSNAVHSVR